MPGKSKVQLHLLGKTEHIASERNKKEGAKITYADNIVSIKKDQWLCARLMDHHGGIHCFISKAWG